MEENVISKRTVYLKNGFSEKNVQEIIGQINALNDEGGDISLIIDSNGGNFIGGLKLYEIIKLSPNPINGLVIGDCFSSATIPLLACQKKQATQYSRFLIHRLTYPMNFNIGIDDVLSNLSKEMSEKLSLIKYNNEIMFNIYLEKLKLFNEESLKDFLKKEKIMYVKEAIGIGLIDEIIQY